MPPPLLFDLAKIDLNRLEYDVAAIERMIPQRGLMRMLDGIIYTSSDSNLCIAFKDVRPDEYWVPGHIPGRPLMPGVLMLECAAQLSSVATRLRLPQVVFMAMIGIDEAKFRGQVVPGDRLHLICVGLECRPRRSVSKVQGVVRGSMVFEAVITGMEI